MTPDESEASPTRTRIPRCSADATAEHVGELLRAHGAVIVERLIDDALCDRLADQLGPWIGTTPTGADAFSGHNTRRTGGLLTPDSAAQMLHRDHWCFDFFPFPRDVDVEVSAIWALTDFTEANGATRVVADSHRTAGDATSFAPR